MVCGETPTREVIMAEETWPRAGIPYDNGARSPEQQRRWQRAIEASLGQRHLTCTASGESGYDLVGSCPRCGHAGISQFIPKVIYTDRGVDRGEDASDVLATRARTASVVIRCACHAEHDGREAGRLGCGYAPYLEVSFALPAGGDDQ
jgi:hypothetical protein